jgi:hypothetical protein
MRGESHAYCSPVIAVRYDHLVPDIALTDLAQKYVPADVPRDSRP